MGPSILDQDDRLAAVAAARRTRRLLLGCVLLAAALRAPLLDDPIWFDEACMSSQRIGTFSQLLATLYVDVHPPLFVVGMHAWNRLFGDGEVLLRLPALLAGLASIPLLYWTGHRLVGDAAAKWAALLLALSPVHLWYSVEARLYAPMIACTLLAIGSFDRLLDPAAARPRWLWPLHLANCAVMLALHYYLAPYVLALLLLAPVAARGWSRPAVRLMAWHAALLLLLAAFVAAKVALGEFATTQDYLRAMTPREAWRWLVWAWTGNTLAPAATTATTVLAAVHAAGGAVLLLLGSLRLVHERHRLPRGWLVPVGLLLLPLALLALALLGRDRTYTERSMLPALPFVLLMAGSGMAALRGRPRIAAAVVVLGCHAAALAGLFALHATHWTVYKPKGDWRAAAAWLGERIEADGEARLLFTSVPNPRPLSYYDARIQDVRSLTPPIDPDRLARRVAARLGPVAGELAADQLRDFVAHHRRLLDGARLLVHPSRRDPDELVLPRGGDRRCFLLRDHWHPHVSVDDSIEVLLQHPRVRIRDEAHFDGISVHQVEILP